MIYLLKELTQANGKQSLNFSLVAILKYDVVSLQCQALLVQYDKVLHQLRDGKLTI